MKHTFTELPTIDICDLAGDDLAKRQAVADVIGHAAREVGFFYITGHGIDLALAAGVREATKQILTLSMEEKVNYYIGHPKSRKGYVPEGEGTYGSGKPNHKEAFGIDFQAADDHPLVLAGTPLVGANEWPDLPGFRAQVLVYYDVVFALNHRLFNTFAFTLGLPEEYLKPMVIYPPAKLRLVYYPFDVGVEGVPGIGAHTDYECFTLLFADQPSLEVPNEENVRIDTPLVKNAIGEEVFVINTGDMLEVFGVDTFVVIVRRVRKVPQERYSFPLFFAYDRHTLIRPPPIFLATGETGECQELSIGEHMRSQALQTYRYLYEKANHGGLQLSERARGTSIFGHLRKQAQQKSP